ncbi:MAG: phosphohistidine phosphatase SixA [Pseudomonas sp.]|uniref:phosphohistidine phosphatase SixA n=1 Tax=Pseudomonas sp. TaxID=306 RepID=UPI0033972C55
MKLWLLRHGEAQAHARSDAERVLTARGIAQVQQSAQRLLGQDIGAMLVSPYVRAQQTAQQVQLALDPPLPLATVSWLTPDSDLREVLRQLDALDDRPRLLVGHQPLLGDLAGWLLHGHRQEPLAMGTACLVELEGEWLAAGQMRLVQQLHPIV